MKNKIDHFLNKTTSHLGWVTILLMMFFSSCRDYLDVVPDNTLTLEDIFSTRTQAYNALAKVYSYLPREDWSDRTTWFLGDEYMSRQRYTYESLSSRVRSMQIMRGLQVTGRPMLGIWGGTGGLDNVSQYQGINVCNVFIDNIDNVFDMDQTEKADWKSQVKFLKAYYHFLLLQRYGPIAIADKQIAPDSPLEDLYPYRAKVDDCFDYIIRTIDESISDLVLRRTSTELGMVDKLAAYAIKARVMLFRASPFYSGNSMQYSDFLDHNKEPFFPIYDDAQKSKGKWKDALDAINAAIKICEDNGKGLYEYNKTIYQYDVADYDANPRMKTLYDLRMLFVDPWNKELIWGYTCPDYEGNVSEKRRKTNHALANIMISPSASASADAYYFCEQWLSATHKMMYRYYTQNGLPLEADINFNSDTQHEIVYTPDVNDADFMLYRGIMQTEHPTINLYLNRELRFYANLGITGGYWRGHDVRTPISLFAGTIGGYWANRSDYYLATGIGVQKIVHPESKAADIRRVVKYPYPIIRLADLYLMKAEARNEYLDAPDPEVWEAINKVRIRAGIPLVEQSWGTPAWVRDGYLNSHQNKDKMRDIILQEKGIELAFEGANRYWDMLRHKRASREFTVPTYGWSILGEEEGDFFTLEIKDSRSFQEAYHLWPIDLDELNRNSHLIQNPGW